MMTRRQCVAAFGGAAILRAAASPLVAQWRAIAAKTDGVVGAAALRLDSGDLVSLRGDERFPLASVCKLPIAMAILAMVADGNLRLDQEIDIPTYDVVPSVSPIAERWLKGEKRFRLDEMIRLMIARSDNTAVQTLFRMAGGAPGLAARLRAWSIDGIRIDRDERECGLDAAGVEDRPNPADWTPEMHGALMAKVPPATRAAAIQRFLRDPRDTGTPDGTVALIRKLYRGNALPEPLTAKLRADLEATTTGRLRIRALLPHGTVVADKTGTGWSAGNLNSATNDVGVITLPRGSQLAVAFYLKGSTHAAANRERTIAKLAKVAYDWAEKG